MSEWQQAYAAGWWLAAAIAVLFVVSQWLLGRTLRRERLCHELLRAQDRELDALREILELQKVRGAVKHAGR